MSQPTSLFAVPAIDFDDIEADFADGDGGGGGGQCFHELQLIAQRLVEAAISRTDWTKYESVANYMVTDPADAKVIVKLMQQASVEVFFESAE